MLVAVGAKVCQMSIFTNLLSVFSQVLAETLNLCLAITL